MVKRFDCLLTCIRGRGAIFAAALALIAIVPGAPAGATPLMITDSPQESSGPFWHNVFHTASSHSAMGGSILGWFGLNPGGVTDTYDPDTGAFQADFLIYSDSGFTNQIASVTGIGSSGLTAALLNGAAGAVAGTITWTFDFSLAPTSALANQVGTGETGVNDITTTFLSTDIVTSSAGYTANSFLPVGSKSFLTLWGANGFSNGAYNNAFLGVDLVVDPSFPVPAPGTLLLFGFGLIGLGLMSGRRKSA